MEIIKFLYTYRFQLEYFIDINILMGFLHYLGMRTRGSNLENAVKSKAALSYNCSICHQLFKQRRYMERHMSSKHQSANTGDAAAAASATRTRDSPLIEGAASNAPPESISCLTADEVGKHALESTLFVAPAHAQTSAADDANGRPLLAADQLIEPPDPLMFDASHNEATGAANTMTDRRREDWRPPPTPFAKLLGGLIVPSINNLTGIGEGGGGEGGGGRTANAKEPPIQTLLQDLSNQEKQILKQIFISNKIGEPEKEFFFVLALKFFLPVFKKKKNVDLFVGFFIFLVNKEKNEQIWKAIHVCMRN